MEPVFLLFFFFFRCVIDSKIWVGFCIKPAVMYPVTDLVFFFIYFILAQRPKIFVNVHACLQKRKLGVPWLLLWQSELFVFAFETREYYCGSFYVNVIRFPWSWRSKKSQKQKKSPVRAVRNNNEEKRLVVTKWWGIFSSINSVSCFQEIRLSWIKFHFKFPFKKK